ncbi:hypothetical protein WJX84_001777 [Apatococcus fuscideae]|uniref:Uncharacterized protein n=1 Tax=Apatococcus fuscideae TaxID=2026836 RepID=A0AAW1SR57_9CHLO
MWPHDKTAGGAAEELPKLVSNSVGFSRLREGSWERRGVSAAAHAAFEASTATASACKVQEKLQVQGPLFYLGGGLAASSSYNSSSPTAFCNTHTTPAASYGGS